MKKRIDLYPVPHVEVRIHVSERMMEDYRKCKQAAEDADYEECMTCKNCSWNCTEFRGTAACEIVEPEQVLGEVK